MFDKVDRLIGRPARIIALVAGLVAAPAWAGTIDAVADQADAAAARKGAGASEAPRHASRRDLRVQAIYGLGTNLRTNLIVDDELVEGCREGSELPRGLKVVKVLPREVDITDGKKVTRLYYSTSAVVSESEENRFANNVGSGTGRSQTVPSMSIMGR